MLIDKNIFVKFLYYLIVLMVLSSCQVNKALDIEKHLASKNPNTLNSSTVPKNMFDVNSSYPVTGKLDIELQHRLKEVTDTILQKASGASVAIILPEKGFWSSHRGTINAINGLPITENNLFQVASITKVFTASIIMQLIKEKRLHLNDRISKWYPDISNAGVMTVEQLLRHTNGLVSFNALPELGSFYHSPDECIRLASQEGSLFYPGSQWAYTNTGYAILGRIIEKIENETLSEVIDKRIVKPLGLKNTLIRRPNDMVSVVDGHHSSDLLQVNDEYATAYAAGGIASTAEDIVKFWYAFMSGKVVSSEQLHSMFSLLKPMDKSGQMFYGMGVQLYNIVPGPGIMLGHSGGITGFRSIVTYIPKDDVYVSVLVNDENVSVEAGLWLIIRTIRKYRSKNN